MAILRIELLDDCDMNSGRVLNTYFAEDVFYDSFGMPYIPAWIITNSLVKMIRDSNFKLSDQEIQTLMKGKDSFVIEDAIIADRESMRQAILADDYGKDLVRNPQTILSASTFTKIKEISGANRQEYIRVLARGTIFESYFEIEQSCLGIIRKIFENTNSLYVGYNVRTRFTIDETAERPVYDVSVPELDFGGEWCRLEYDLHLISRTVTLNHISRELDTEAYISGALLLDALKDRADLSDHIGRNENLKFSYAYIDVSGKRGIPIPAGFSTKKQDKNDLRDLCSEGRREDDYDQIKGIGTLFIDDPDGSDIYAVSVRKEHGLFHYDKDGKFKSKTYSAIAAGQTFKGFIEGPAADIQSICESLIKNVYVHIGDLRGVGFGNAYLEVKSVKPLTKYKPVYTDEIQVLLISPARLYRNGYYEASAENVLKEIQHLLGDDTELEIIKCSQRTCCISDYNRAWNEMEAVEYALKAGSVFRIKSKDGKKFDISPALGTAFIGGHNDRGYGEVLVLPAVDKYYRTIRYGEFLEKDFALSRKADPNPGRRLMRKVYQNNANTIASFLGAVRAEECVDEAMHSELISEIRTALKDNFDLEEVFEVYMDSLKEAGLNVIRRKRHE